MNIEELLQLPQYSLPQAEKEHVLLQSLEELSRHHRERSPEYNRLVSIMFPEARPASLADLPYLPVGLFKEHPLASIPQSEVFRTLQSSGTTGQQPSRILLDRETAQLQTQALARIMTHVLGPRRLPMILVESSGLVRDRRQFNARAAGLLGMMNFGRDHFYALDENLDLDVEGLQVVPAEVGKGAVSDFRLHVPGLEPLLLGFGWFRTGSFPRGTLIHSGGWKKLQEQAVTAPVFREKFQQACGLTRIYNFYGMVEQVGSIFLEGEDGYLYPPNFADVIIRDPITLEELPPGQTGVIEVLSVLPRSYPGHCLLTEDLGVVHGIDSMLVAERVKLFLSLDAFRRLNFGVVAMSSLHRFSDGSGNAPAEAGILAAERSAELARSGSDVRSVLGICDLCLRRAFPANYARACCAGLSRTALAGILDQTD